MKELLLASQNEHKRNEIQAILSQVGYKVVLPSEVGIGDDFDVEETGKTFAENSELKARAFGEKSQMLSVADDSGLSVDVLGGRPGVFSKRYAEGGDLARNTKLLGELAEQENRAAEFVTDLCLYDPSTREVHHFEGKIRGQIAQKVRGTAGFGFDPLFIPEGHSQTFAELGQEVKNQLSHRSRAVAQLEKYLAKTE